MPTPTDIGSQLAEVDAKCAHPHSALDVISHHDEVLDFKVKSLALLSQRKDTKRKEGVHVASETCFGAHT